MKKYKNLGDPFGVIVEGKTFDWEHDEIVEAPEKLKEKMETALSKIVPLDEVEEETPVPLPVVPSVPEGFKSCLQCGKAFKPRRREQKFCSRKCYNGWRKKT